MNLLYVEDDREAQSFVQGALRRNRLLADLASDGPSGLEKGLTGDYDLIVLDVMLPGMSGLEVLRRLRTAGVKTPVLLLTAQVGVSHRIEGLNLGADDYLEKPFAFAELLARIRAIARRSSAEPADGIYTVADLEVDVRRHTVRRAGRRIHLTPKEFQLLENLVRNAGHVVSRTMLVDKVWGSAFESYSNVIDVHVNRLRNKIDKDFHPAIVHTAKGIGYVLEEPSP